MRVMLYAIRRTFGYQKRHDPISLSQYIGGQHKKDGTVLDHGTGLARATVIVALENLVKYHVLIKLGRGKHGDVWEPQTHYDQIDWDGLNERQTAAQDKAKRRTVQPLDQANRKRRSNGQTTSGLTVRPEVVYPLDTQNPVNPRNPLGAEAPKVATTTPPICADNPTQSPPKEYLPNDYAATTAHDPLEAMYLSTIKAQAAPAETIIRAWNLPDYLTDICLTFAHETGMTVTKGDKGKWAKGASSIHELHATRAQLKAACMKARNQKGHGGQALTITHPRAIYETVKAVMSVPVAAPARVVTFVGTDGRTYEAEEC